MSGTPKADIERAIARDVRAQLLSVAKTPRDLAGECGIASMLMTAALGNRWMLRTGFFMARGQMFGKAGRYPHRHAWCVVETTIVDATATQFGRHHRAVHHVEADADDHYIETASGPDAIDDIMNNWRGRESAAYAELAKTLRRSCL